MSTLKEEIADFIRHLRHEKQYSPHTCENYARDLQLLAAQLAPLDSWYHLDESRLKAIFGSFYQRKKSGRSIARMMASCRSFYRYIIWQKDWDIPNPAQNLRAPRYPKKLPKLLDVDAMIALLEQKPITALMRRDLAIAELFYSSGIRLAELQGLNLEHVNWRQKILRVKGKGGHDRYALLGDKALLALRDWLKIREGKNAVTALFTTTKGTRLSKRQIQSRLKKLANQKDQHLHPHMCRHAFASHILESGGDLRAIQELLGHKNLTSTQIYTHLDFQRLATIYDQAHPRAHKKPPKKTN